MKGVDDLAQLALRPDDEAGDDPGDRAQNESAQRLFDRDRGVEQQRAVGQPLPFAQPDRAGAADVERHPRSADSACQDPTIAMNHAEAPGRYS